MQVAKITRVGCGSFRTYCRIEVNVTVSKSLSWNEAFQVSVVQTRDEARVVAQKWSAAVSERPAAAGWDGRSRRNLVHTSRFPRCCDWPRRHSRAPSERVAPQAIKD